MDELVDRALLGDVQAVRALEELLDRLAWRTVSGAFPSKPASAEDLALIDTCVRLRRERRFQTRAGAVLANLSLAEVNSALRRARTARPRERAQALVPSELLTRYRGGDHEGAWAELHRLGSLQTDEERQEAEAVAAETMTRAAAAIDELVNRLAARGYPLRAETRCRPVPVKSLQRLTRASGGPVPPSLAAFWQIVGGVDLSPDWERDNGSWWPSGVDIERVDPLVVDQLDRLWWDVETWKDRDEGDEDDSAPRHILSIAPDRYHKMNISGGSPYSVALPQDSADAVVLGLDYVDSDPPFVSYLRDAVRAGGFPGVAACGDPGPEWPTTIRDLTEGLEPF